MDSGVLINQFIDQIYVPALARAALAVVEQYTPTDAERVKMLEIIDKKITENVQKRRLELLGSQTIDRKAGRYAS